MKRHPPTDVYCSRRRAHPAGLPIAAAHAATPTPSGLGAQPHVTQRRRVRRQNPLDRITWTSAGPHAQESVGAENFTSPAPTCVEPLDRRRGLGGNPSRPLGTRDLTPLPSQRRSMMPWWGETGDEGRGTWHT